MGSSLFPVTNARRSSAFGSGSALDEIYEWTKFLDGDLKAAGPLLYASRLGDFRLGFLPTDPGESASIEAHVIRNIEQPSGYAVTIYNEEISQQSCFNY